MADDNNTANAQEANQNANQNNQEPAAKPAQNTQTAQNTAQTPSADDIAKIVDETIRLREKEAAKKTTGITRSMAEQNGMTEEQLTAYIEEKLKERAAKLPPDVQKRIDEAEAKVVKMQVSADVSKIGTEMGLVDVDVALTLIPDDAIKVNDKGEIKGTKEALEKLKTDKPYLFQRPGAMAQRLGGTPAGTEQAAYDEKMRRAITGGRPPKEEKK